MQTFGLHSSIYKLNRLVAPEEKLDPRFMEIKNKVKTWQKLKNRSVPDEEIAEAIGISRASFYRYRKTLATYGIKGLERKSQKPKTYRTSNIKDDTISLILKLRLENPSYGKAKITVILRRDHAVILSESSVGRVLKTLTTQGKIKRSVSSLRVRRKRHFKAHAKPWKYGMQAVNPGELIQIDHMSVTKHNISMKEFRAWDPITKTIVADVVSNASSAAAAKFLYKVIKDLPFPVKSVQVDGGSEFMKDFEDACGALGISLFVLPPRRPQWNGGVERANRTFREELYARTDIEAESIGAFRHELQKAVVKYNTYRPHFNLKGKTPYEYTKEILAA